MTCVIRLAIAGFCLAYEVVAGEVCDDQDDVSLVQLRKHHVTHEIAQVSSKKTNATHRLEKASLVGVNASIAADNQTAFLSFSYAKKRYAFNLLAFRAVREGARIMKHSRTESTEVNIQPTRMFRSRVLGKWATAWFYKNGTVLAVVKLDGNIVHLRPSPLSDMTNVEMLQCEGGQPHFLELVAVSEDSVLPAASESASTPAATESGYEHFKREIFDDEWTGESFTPGCYDGDDEMHTFTIKVIADIAATRKYGDETFGKMEVAVALASFVYEHQFNLRLVIGDSELFEEDGESHPDFALPGTDGSMECEPLGESGTWMETKLVQVKNANFQTFGATYLFSGCFDETYLGELTSGMAYRGAACAKKWAVGIALIRADEDTWLTFAHEIGHTFGAHHSSVHGVSGGIMDYGGRDFEGELQYIPQNRPEICGVLDVQIKTGCYGNFLNTPTTRTTTTTTTTTRTTTTTTITTPEPTPEPTPDPTPEETPETAPTWDPNTECTRVHVDAPDTYGLPDDFVMRTETADRRRVMINNRPWYTGQNRRRSCYMMYEDDPLTDDRASYYNEIGFQRPGWVLTCTIDKMVTPTRRRRKNEITPCFATETPLNMSTAVNQAWMNINDRAAPMPVTVTCVER